MGRPFHAIYPIGLPGEGELWTDVADELGVTADDYPASLAEAKRMGVVARNLFR